MRFTISREKLQEGLAMVAASIPSKTTLPVLANILIETTDKGIRLSGTDLDIAVSTEVTGGRRRRRRGHHPREEVDGDRAGAHAVAGQVRDRR